jgi:FtsP/CotA-like multicopper oxidase with cupredoxin domain
MKNILEHMPTKDERKVKRTINVSIGFVGILLVAGILFTVLLLNSSVSSAASAGSDASYNSAANTPDNQALTSPDSAVSDTKTEDTKIKSESKRITPAERNAAAKRLKSSLISGAIAPGAAIGIAAVPPGPGSVPDYFGIYPNYASSPLPTVAFTGTTPTTVGNPLIDRAYATDYATPPGTLAPVFVVVPSAMLPAGTLENIQIWNQATTGGSPTPSAGNIFHAYVLHPTGTPNQYTVVFDSGNLTVPTLPAGSNGQVETFTMAAYNVQVQAGDVIGFYGEGIPVDVGGGTDILSYNASGGQVPAPTQGSTITLGSDPFPINSQDRTYSIAATVNVGGVPVVSGGIRKFVDPLPSLTIAVPDTCTYSGQEADCYDIELREYTQQMHSDLPPTKLRGYVQVKNGVDVAPISYLGPVIVAQRDRPVRVKFTNVLPTGTGGDLFLPVDTTYMGAGTGPKHADGTPCDSSVDTTCANYTQNRATLHLHGGTTPWISDGTPHQWITPANENTPYPKGVSVQNVPDMPDPGSGSQTFYYTNEQSARLMFYHDHAYGITRLNVYAGEAAGYLLTDTVEQTLINGGTITPPNGTPVTVSAGTLPDIGIPLIIQDKTFVPDNTTPFTNQMGTFASQLMAQDPTWDSAKWGGYGQLWFPHVYMPNQNPGDLSGANPMGRWDYGPWFWPPFTGLQFGPIPNPYYNSSCVSSETQYCEGSEIPGTPDARLISPSGVPEAFMDTPLVNGKAYPVLNVSAGPVRFRILNAANDRFWNLQLYVADPNVTTADGRKNTEVKMVPFNSNQNLVTPFPSWWYTPGLNFVFDDRAGGVPDPTKRGPAMIQIGTEGGFLPAPAVILNQPVNYVYNRRDITVLNVNEKALFLGPAERADVIVDFSKFAGKTLILYNDAPAPVPAADPRIDYYTGDLDQTDTGGAPSTLAGYGPNTRTIMQINVGAGLDSSAPVDDYNPATLAALQTALPAAFNASQDTIITPQAPYNAVYNANFPGDASAYVKIQDTNHTFDPIGPIGNITMEMEPKSIIEDFTMDYGRMNAILGNEVPHTNVVTQTSIIQAFIDPPVEIINITDVGTPIGSLSDGTQIWKITHNGVDTHAIHFHLFNVQVVNRIGWDGAIKPPDPNELGWKDTVRMNPLEDIVVALRPIKLTNLPFKIPNSIRPLDVTRPLGSTMGFTNVDPNGNPVTPGITNQLVNFGWEYVYHCHLLGHEENDMMRPVVVSLPPDAPFNLSATGLSGPLRVVLTWTDNSVDETNFTIQRATDAGFTTGLATFMVAGSTPNSATGGTIAFTDTTVAANTQYYYRVLASNVVGALNLGAYPTNTVNSVPSNSVTVGPPAAAPSNLNASQPNPANSAPVVLNWTDNSPNVPNPPNFNAETSFTVQRSTNGGGTWINRATLPGNAGTGAMTYTDLTSGPNGVKRRTTYTYRILANNIFGSSTSNVATITTR